MAKAALENAVWDLEAQKKKISLADLLGGTRSVIPCGVSIGIQPSPAALMEKIAEELEAGYQRIKLKCKPGWDTKIFEQVRARWPDIRLSCDANSAYRVVDIDHIAEWDEFDLMMIEQPLWYDDFYFHSMLQKRLDTPICLDESIRNRRDALAAIDMDSCRIINIKVGRVGGFSEAIAVHNADGRARSSGMVRRHAGDRHRARAQYRAVVAAELLAAGGRFRVAALLGRRHHRARGDGQRAGRDRGAGREWAPGSPCCATASRR